MSEPKYFTDFFLTYSGLNFSTSKSCFKSNCVELFFITNMLSKTSDPRPCLTLNVSMLTVE